MRTFIGVLVVVCLLVSCGPTRKKKDKPEPEKPERVLVEENGTLLEHVLVKECTVAGSPPSYRITFGNQGSSEVAVAVIPWFYTDRGARLLYPNDDLTLRLEAKIAPGEAKTFEGRAPFLSAKSLKLESVEE